MKKIINKALSSAVAVVLMAPSAVGMINANATGTPRDPNGDGVINIADAVFIYQYLLGANLPQNLTPLDFDQNGIVSAIDARLIQSYDAGVEFNPPIPNASANDPVNAVEAYSSRYCKHNCRSTSKTSYTTYTIEEDIYNNNGISTLSIIQDNMIRNNDTSVVRIKNRTNNNLIGSGFIVGNHKIATTAYNVFDCLNLEFRDLVIEVVDSDNNLIGTYYPHYIHIPKTYRDDAPTSEYNYAMLYFDENLSSYGQFNLGVALDSYISNGGIVTVSGFPGTAITGYNTTDLRTQSTGHITGRRSETSIGHTADTMYGTDGGPVYAADGWSVSGTLIEDDSVVIGIQSRSMGSFNEAVPINSEMLKFYSSNN